MVGFPFDSEISFDDVTSIPVYDRAVSSQPLRKLIRDLFTTGVMPNPSTNLQVSAGLDGMTIQVQTGFAVVDGGLCQETEIRTLEVTAADNTYDRIDTVVLRWNENVDARTADLYVIQGTPSANPVRPELQRDNSIYEIGLADVFITKRVATITNDKITDTRYEAERCGVVSSVSEWDTTTIYQQVQADLAEFKTGEESDFATWSTAQQAAFEDWFETIRGILDEDVAGHLQLEIDGLRANIGLDYDTYDEAMEDIANIPDGARVFTKDEEGMLNDIVTDMTATHLVGSQRGTGNKNITLPTDAYKRLLIITKKSGKVWSQTIPIDSLDNGDVIPLGNTTPVIGTNGTPYTGTTIASNLINKPLGIGKKGTAGTQDWPYSTADGTTKMDGTESIGLATDLSNTTGATLTYNGGDSFTITVTDSTLSVFVYCDSLVLGGSASGRNVSVNLVGTGLMSTDAEGAIKEVNTKATDIQNVVNGIETGSVTNSGQTRTITLEGNYSSMKYFNISMKSYENVQAPRAVTFTAPNTVTYQLTYGANYVTGSLDQDYLFIGVPQ